MTRLRYSRCRSTSLVMRSSSASGPLNPSAYSSVRSVISFTFVKDGDDDEPAEHCTVDLGPAPTVEEAKRFLRVFDQVRRRSM